MPPLQVGQMLGRLVVKDTVTKTADAVEAIISVLARSFLPRPMGEYRFQKFWPKDLLVPASEQAQPESKGEVSYQVVDADYPTALSQIVG